MPKSKRAKVVHLSKVEKKDKEHRQKIFTEVQEAAEAYPYIYVFRVSNMRNTYLKEIRSEFSDSRLFFAKTKIMAKALGTTPESSHLPGLSLLAPYLHGDVGLLCTPRPPSDILPYFRAFSQTDFARAGVPASFTFTLPAGVLHAQGGQVPSAEDTPVQHSSEPMLRRWGLPTRLDKGKVVLDEEYTVCEEGKVLNSHQTALLKFFGVAMAEFKITVEAYWTAETGDVKKVDGEAMEE
ncbi:uncharacterized protein PV09_05058 [Verruconis gallopava]|uniref:Ribosome assembly factor mrt4 n=1 Tax=Verruconis gallopava TaxID=253628 RepID=A0A0D1YSY3_9PEZI|nr:uncharacterized protein PV09_05058 [Verruconis gallopava]KIW03752.1 hypothetical protein PV09_05058 [Verruconis gallopava]